MDDIRNAVGRPNGEEVIQPIAERIRVSTNVDYIVILDMNRIRYSHPSESRIGQVFEGGDELAAFSELEYTSFFLSPLCKRFIMGIIKLMGMLINIPVEVGTLLIKQVCK